MCNSPARRIETYLATADASNSSNGGSTASTSAKTPVARSGFSAETKPGGERESVYDVCPISAARSDIRAAGEEDGYMRREREDAAGEGEGEEEEGGLQGIST